MTILVCGEALYDVFQTGAADDGSLTFDARVGGSPFNVAIGIARQGGKAAFLTGISKDLLGQRLVARLETEGVDTRHIIRSGRRTTLSLVGLDAQGHPDYAFYGVGSADVSVTVQDMPVLPDSIEALHFGSYAIAVPPAADAYAQLAERYQDRFLSLDPNIRPTIEPDMGVWRARIDRMRVHCNLIKVSVEDLDMLYPGHAPDQIARDWLHNQTELVIVTDGANGARAFSAREELAVPGKQIAVVDTVGAGDSFHATTLQGLQARNVFTHGAGWAASIELGDLLARSVNASAIVCGRVGADMPSAREIDHQIGYRERRSG